MDEMTTVDFDRSKPHQSVVLERIEPGKLPEHCIHGRVTCMYCDEWCWLGHNSHDVVRAGDAVPMCLPCAIKLIPPGTESVGNLNDHRRADGPHE